jgi:hypothetical protein
LVVGEEGIYSKKKIVGLPKMLKICLLAASALACSAFQAPASFPNTPQLRMGRCSTLPLRMTATEPAPAVQIGKRAEHFSASFAHPTPVTSPFHSK